MSSNSDITAAVKHEMRDLAQELADLPEQLGRQPTTAEVLKVHQTKHRQLVSFVVRECGTRFKEVLLEELRPLLQQDVNSWGGAAGVTTGGSPSAHIEIFGPDSTGEHDRITMKLASFTDYFFGENGAGTWCGLYLIPMHEDVILEHIQINAWTGTIMTDNKFLKKRLEFRRNEDAGPDIDVSDPKWFNIRAEPGNDKLEFAEGEAPFFSRPYRLVYDAPELDGDGHNLPAIPGILGDESEHLLDFIIGWIHLETFRDRVNELANEYPHKIDQQFRSNNMWKSTHQQLVHDGFRAWVPTDECEDSPKAWVTKLAAFYENLMTLSQCRDKLPTPEHVSGKTRLRTDEKKSTIWYQPTNRIKYADRAPSTLLVRVENTKNNGLHNEMEQEKTRTLGERIRKRLADGEYDNPYLNLE